MREYLTIHEAAIVLRIAPRTLRNKMARGGFREGEHYFRPPGLGPRFKRAALHEWVEGRASRASLPTPLAVNSSNSKACSWHPFIM